MRIFYKMKKALLVATALIAVNVAFAESKTVNYVQNDTDNKPGAEAVNVSLDAISFSYLGDANGWDVKANKQNYSGNSYTHYVSGKSNPTITDGVPTAGSVFGFVPKYDGQFALCMVVNASKATYVLEDGVGLSSFDVDGKWNDGSVADTTIASGGKLKDKCYGVITFDVKANKQYYVYCTGSKMGYYGFSYTYEEAVAGEVADTLKLDVVNELELGKTYIIGASGMHKVSFTAPADGFLNLTTSQRINRTSLKINGATSTFSNENGGFSKKGMAEGSIFEGQFYVSGTPSAENTYSFILTFEEGVPYEPITLSEMYPADGGEWSAAAYYWPNLTSYQGQPYLSFSLPINTTSAVASVKIGEKVYSPLKLYVSSQRMTLQSLPDTLKAAVAEGLIKPGESFQITLTGVEDKEFPANKLADLTFSYTLASTACTGVTPVASTSRTELPQEVVFSFDGEVKIDDAKFFFIDGTGKEIELTGATVDGNSVKIPVTGIEGLLPKTYDIVAKGVTNVDGKVITYGNTVGQLTASYGTSNGYFKPVASPANYDNVASLKTYTFTLPANVVYDATLATDTISFSKLNEETYGWEAVEGVTPSFEIKDNVVTVTLSKEVTAAGDYRLSVPAYLFWSEGLYDKDNLTKTNCYYMPSQNITCTILPYGPTAVTPQSGSLVNKIEQLVLSFDEPVDFDATAKVVVNMYKEVDNDWGFTDYVEVPIAEYGFDYDYTNYNNLIVKVGSIDSVGMYTIVIPEGSIWTVANEAKKVGKWVYQYQVDPEYWDPEWVVEVGLACTKEEPFQLIEGRKYSFTEMYTYLQFTAEETGRVYIIAEPDSKTGSLWLNDENWVRGGNLKSTEGGFWFGVTEGETYNIVNYGFGSRIVKVTFVEGNPYEDLKYIGSSPVDGGIYSKSAQAEYSYSKGCVDFLFSDMVNDSVLNLSLVLPAQENKEIDITEEVAFEVESVYGKGARVTVDLRDVVENLKETQELKAGDKFQIVLKNVQDASFEDNKAENVIIELTLAATICTSVYPNGEYDVDAIPMALSLQFDGAVSCASGKGYIIDLANTENKQEFEIKDLTTSSRESFDGSMVYTASVELPEATITLTSRRFAIQLEGLVDSEGNAVSYGEELGKFIIEYALSAEILLPVSPEEDEEVVVESMKTTTLTFAEEVCVSPDAEAYFYTSDYDEVYGTLAVDANDPKSVIITWSKEITSAGAYNVNVETGSIYNSKFDAEADDYGVENGAIYNPFISFYCIIPANNSSTTIASITPAAYEGRMWGTPISKLPAQVVIEFEGNVKEVISAYGQNQGLGGGIMSLDDDMLEDDDMEVPSATALETKLVDNVLYLTIPQKDIDAVTFGYYNIVINAIGEDDKPIGFAMDDWGDIDAFAEQISFNYYVVKMLDIVEMTPAPDAIVKQLDKVTITFDEECELTEDAYIKLFDEEYNYASEVSVDVNGKVVTLTFDTPVTTAGSYILNIGEASFATEDWVYNIDHRINFIVNPNFVEELAIVSATPENGATVANLTTVEFKLNKEVGYLYKSMLIPSDEGDDAASASLTQSETDPTSYTLDFTFDGLFANGATLRKDVTYTLTLEAYASEEAWQRDGAHETVTLTYVGAAEAFKYSDVTFESITPAEDFVISDKSQNKFVVKFSGAVEMVENLTFVNMGQGATQAFESIVPNADKTEYTLTIAESVLETLRNEVYIVFAANDAEGKRVQGNNGEEENSCFAISFKTVIGVPDLTVTPDATAEQASLSVLTIGCAEGLAPSWNAGNITLTDANGNTVALNDPEAVVAEGADEFATPTAWTVALVEELKRVGTYTLTIPAGYFNLGKTQGQVMGNKDTVVVFNITEKAQGINAITVDSEVVVYNIAGVAVAQGKASEVLKNLNKGIYIVNGKKFVVK